MIVPEAFLIIVTSMTSIYKSKQKLHDNMNCNF